jgi:hypothetical protein
MMRISIPCWTHIVMLSWVCTDSAVLNSVMPALLQWWCACRTQKSNEIKIACWCVCTTHRMMIACERTVNTRPDNKKSNDLGVLMHQNWSKINSKGTSKCHFMRFRSEHIALLSSGRVFLSTFLIPHSTEAWKVRLFCLASESPVSHQWVASESPVSRQWVTSESPVSRQWVASESPVSRHNGEHACSIDSSSAVVVHRVLKSLNEGSYPMRLIRLYRNYSDATMMRWWDATMMRWW